MKNVNFEVALPVTFLREGDAFIAYTPALDLSTCAGTFEHAQKRFAEAVQLFFEETSAMGTLDEVLSDLGWRKQNSDWMPPTVIAQESQTVRIPARA